MIESIDNSYCDPAIIPPGSLVFDIGALAGGFSTIMADRGFRCIAFEPDPEGIKSVPQHESIVKAQLAVGYPPGMRKFFRYAPSSGANGFYLNQHMEKDYPSTTIEVEAITLEDAIARYGIPEIVKINAEGAEVEIVLGAKPETLKSIGQLTISFHTFCGFVTPEQEQACRARLELHGFALSRYDVNGKYMDACCAIRGLNCDRP